MRAECVNLSQVHPKIIRNTWFDTPVVYQEGELHYEATVKIYGPFELISLPGESLGEAVRRLEMEIHHALNSTFEKKPNEEGVTVNQLKCDNCDATTDPENIGPGWNAVRGLYNPRYEMPPPERHFCSDSCEFAYVIRNARTPLTLTLPKS